MVLERVKDNSNIPIKISEPNSKSFSAAAYYLFNDKPLQQFW